VEEPKNDYVNIRSGDAEIRIKTKTKVMAQHSPINRLPNQQDLLIIPILCKMKTDSLASNENSKNQQVTIQKTMKLNFDESS
jgi:hypothetical protein